MPETRRCKVCKSEFVRYTTIQNKCIPCAIEKGREAQAKERRKDTRRRKEKLKTRSDWLREAQTAFNAYIRERDKDENCISCGRQPRKRNAGHYRSVGSAPELRFSELNCHLQCEHCNTYKSGNQADYRLALVGRIGESNLAWVEGPHQPQKWTIDEIIEIKAYYKQQLKILKQGE